MESKLGFDLKKPDSCSDRLLHLMFSPEGEVALVPVMMSQNVTKIGSSKNGDSRLCYPRTKAGLLFPTRERAPVDPAGRCDL